MGLIRSKNTDLTVYEDDKLIRYDAMCREDEVYTDMVNYYLFEKAFDKHRDYPEGMLRRIMKKTLRELKSDNIL